MAAEFGAARAAYQRAREIYDELGLRLLAGGLAVVSGAVELAMGNPAAAETELRFGVEIAAEFGSSGVLAEDAALLAVVLLAQGKRSEAAEFVEVSRRNAAPAHLMPQILSRVAQARLDADERLARDAVALADETDSLNLQGDARASLANVLEICGEVADASVARDHARALYARKGNAAAVSLLATTRV
jgi:hypothetical protein